MTASRFIQRMKPGVPRLVHLFGAPLLWTVAGSMLLVRGWSWLGTGTSHYLIVAAILIGTFKSLLVLDKVAYTSLQRLVLFKDGTCLGAIYSWKSWILMTLMLVVGCAVRCFGHPGRVLGMVYCAVGWSLCFSSRVGWSQWYACWKNKKAKCS